MLPASPGLFEHLNYLRPNSTDNELLDMKLNRLTQAQEIRDETSDNANTATRVGTMDEDSADSNFNLTTDDSDDIIESATKVFLDSSGDQTISGIKEFSGSACPMSSKDSRDSSQHQLEIEKQ